MLCGACSGADPATDGFVAQLRDARLPRRIEPRLSIDLIHRACDPPPRAHPAVPSALCAADPDDREARTRAGILQARARAALAERVDPDAMHAYALVNLLWMRDEPALADSVVEQLQAAARLASSPDLLADLAAAYLVRAGVADRPDDLTAAIDAAHRALAADPHHAAARHTAALAEQRLALDRAAAEDWDALLARDGDSPWAAEARRHRGQLGRAPPPPTDLRQADTAALAAFAGRDPRAAREQVLFDLLPAWASAVRQGDTVAAGAALRRAEVVGRALLRRPGGDASVADLARAARRAPPIRITAVEAFMAGTRASEPRDFDTVAAHFRQAARLAGDWPALRGWALQQLGRTQFYAQRSTESERTFRALLGEVDSVRYPALAGSAHNSLTTLFTRAGEYQQAIEESRAAEALFIRAGEWPGVWTAVMLASEAAYSLGDEQGGARGTYRVLHGLRGSPASQWRHNQLYVAAQAATNAGLAHAAVRLLDDGVLAPGLTPPYRAEIRLVRATALAGTGRGAAARADIAEGARLLDSVPDAFAQGWHRQDLAVARVALEGHRSPAALARLDSIIAYFDQPDRIPRLVSALVARAEARASLGDLDGAGADLDSVSRMLVRQRGAIRSVSLRTAALEAGRAVTERLAMLHVRAGRPREALVALERGRSPLLAAAPSPGGALPRAPADRVLATLALVGDTLLAWTRREGDLRLRLDTLPRDTLARLIDRVNEGLEDGVEREGALAGLERLHRLLVPLLGPLPVGAELVVMADGALARVPYAALRDPATGRYLLEDRPVRFAATLAEAAAPRPPRAPADARAVFVAPEFDTLRHRRLPPLPQAREEVREIAARYPGSEVLAGPGATPSRLRSALPGAALVHFAGHAVFDDARPSRSYLVLAPEPGGDTIRADELERMELRGVRLVVLSACRTQRAAAGGASGLSGLTASVMAAGAGGVIGSLWRVNDAQTRVLMTAFHHAYRAGGDPSAALREAQLTLLRSPDPDLRSPAAWAGFRYAGH